MDNYECHNCMWEGNSEEIKHVMVRRLMGKNQDIMTNPNLDSVLEEKECCPTCKSHETLVNVDEERRYENNAHTQWGKFYL